jgi:hypothetical protein
MKLSRIIINFYCQFSAKLQRRFKNCKEIAAFFVSEDYLTIFASRNANVSFKVKAR